MTQPQPVASAEKATALAEGYEISMGNHLMIESAPPQRSFSTYERVGVINIP